MACPAITSNKTANSSPICPKVDLISVVKLNIYVQGFRFACQNKQLNQSSSAGGAAYIGLLNMVKTDGQFTIKCKGNTVITLKRQISFL